METVTKQLSWDEFRKTVFTDAMTIVQNSNCSTFKLMGYKHLHIRLILYFDDCNQIFDFQKRDNEIKIEKFFTVDKTHEEHMAELGQWKNEIGRDIKEII